VKLVVGFFRFWYDFIVGDDWLMAATLVVVIALAALLAGAGVSIWWLTPLAVAATLAASLRRAAGDR
jgi:hypothetical protein